jgi:hypothetical protein
MTTVNENAALRRQVQSLEAGERAGLDGDSEQAKRKRAVEQALQHEAEMQRQAYLARQAALTGVSPGAGAGSEGGNVVSDNLGIVVHQPLPLPRLVYDDDDDAVRNVPGTTGGVGTDGAVVVVPGGRVAVVGAGAAAVRGEREKQLEWKRVQEEKQSAFEDEEFVDRDPDLE